MSRHSLSSGPSQSTQSRDRRLMLLASSRRDHRKVGYEKGWELPKGELDRRWKALCKAINAQDEAVFDRLCQQWRGAIRQRREYRNLLEECVFTLLNPWAIAQVLAQGDSLTEDQLVRFLREFQYSKAKGKKELYHSAWEALLPHVLANPKLALKTAVEAMIQFRRAPRALDEHYEKAKELAFLDWKAMGLGPIFEGTGWEWQAVCPSSRPLLGDRPQRCTPLQVAWATGNVLGCMALLELGHDGQACAPDTAWPQWTLERASENHPGWHEALGSSPAAAWAEHCLHRLALVEEDIFGGGFRSPSFAAISRHYRLKRLQRLEALPDAERAAQKVRL